MKENIYEKFETMFDKACNDIVDKYNPVAVSVSGGIDSVVILMGIHNTGKPYYIVNMRYPSDHKCHNKVWSNYMVYELAMHLNAPLICFPANWRNLFARVYSQAGIKLFITGEGMGDLDDAVRNKGAEPTIGEDFHSKYPLLDKLFVTVPERVKYRDTAHFSADTDHTGKKTNLIREDYRFDEKSIVDRKDDVNVFGVKNIAPCYHPLFKEFFKNYKHSIKDMFFPKYLYHDYVKKHLGMPYYKFCKYVTNKYKNNLTPIPVRILEHIKEVGPKRLKPASERKHKL